MIRMCLDCRTLTDTPVLLYTVERQSGPPFSVYVCPDCAPRRLTEKESMRLLFEHCETCPGCTPVTSCPTGRLLTRVHARCLRR
ncbi:hypothetical protein ABT348_24085 [Streptomyces olivaceus]|uniref:hypothetical protein n=1 Tax=Streptomyces olivaceus TaxID=47716 RepID=UPI00331C89F7